MLECSDGSGKWKNMIEKRIVLYGCAWETEKFIKNNPDLDIAFCLDDTLHGRSFLKWNIYSPKECVSSLKGNLVLIFTRNPVNYNRIKTYLAGSGLNEFEDFIPYYLYGKKLTLTWGNCHVGQVKNYLLYSREFAAEYAFYEMTDIWRMKESEIDSNIFKHCQLLVSQDIRKENSLGYSFSSENIESMLSGECIVIKFPNLFGMPKFLYPDLDVKNCFLRQRGGVKWYRDKFLDELIKTSDSYEGICLAICSRKFNNDLLEKGKEEFFNKLREREVPCNIHISDFLQEHFTDTKLFLDLEHPSKYVLCEIANRILDKFQMNRLREDTYLFSSYGHEVITYPGIKKYFGFTWKDEDIKRDNPNEKLCNVYMDRAEYIQEYIQVYSEGLCVDQSAISYKACILKNGLLSWLTLVGVNEIAGTVGEGTALNGIYVEGRKELDIRYKVYFVDSGWSDEKRGGEECFFLGGYAAGFWLSYNASSEYLITYQGHFQRLGWSKWCNAGEVCSNGKYRLEAIRINVQKRSDVG